MLLVFKHTIVTVIVLWTIYITTYKHGERNILPGTMQSHNIFNTFNITVAIGDIR